MSTDAPSTAPRDVVHSTVPARIERLPWSGFQRRLVVALGVCWVLDGFEITIAGSLGERLDAGGLGLGTVTIGGIASVYLVGQVAGALVFGHLSDRLGRRRLFFATLALYMAGSAATAFVPVGGGLALLPLYASRFVAGAGIGGEYTAMNSMIDEFVPASMRGHVDIAVNGTYWAGAALAGAVQIPLLGGAVDPHLGWRVALLLGPAATVAVWFLRRRVPESPRWLISRGRVAEAEEATRRIEDEVDPGGASLRPVDAGASVAIAPREGGFGYVVLVRLLLRAWPRRALLAATVMVAQSFFYNAVFFMYPSILVRFFDVGADLTGEFMVPFAVGNLLGPLVLGPLFDRVGRRRMIFRTFVASGLLLLATAAAFGGGLFTATTQTLVWCVVFFFASAGASAAYLTISEIFPVEVRAKSVAIFFGLAQLVGSFGPLVLGLAIGGDRPRPAGLVAGLAAAAVIMVAAGIAARRLAVDAEGRSLEDVSPPLSFVASTPRGRDR